MEQGNVKRLKIKSLIFFTTTSSFLFPFSCDLSDIITLQTMKTIISLLTIFQQYFFDDYFSGCEITSEGMKEISSFLSHNGIVLEELNLSLKEKKKSLIKHQTDVNYFGVKDVFILLKD